MNRFKQGDEAQVVKPKDLEVDLEYKDSTSDAANQWICEMDSWNGNVITLERFSSGGGWRGEKENGDWFWFLEDWLQPVDGVTAVDPNDAYDRAMGIL